MAFVVYLLTENIPMRREPQRLHSKRNGLGFYRRSEQF